MYTIIVTDLYSSDPSSKTTSHEIQKDKATIGRANDNDVTILQTNVSSYHAEILKTEQGFFLKDLNSTNGSIVNKVPVQNSIRIFSDDQIELGGTLIRVTGHPDLERRNARLQEVIAHRNHSHGIGERPEEPNLNDLLPEIGNRAPRYIEGGPPPGDDLSLSKIASEPFGTPRPSLSLDDLLPSDEYGGALPASSSDNTFPEVDADSADNEPYRDSADKLDLLNKIKSLESKAIADKANVRHSEKRRAPVDAFLGHKTPQKFHAAPVISIADAMENGPEDRRHFANMCEAKVAPFPEMETEQQRLPKNSLRNSKVIVKIIDPVPSGMDPISEYGDLPIFIGRDEDCEISLQDPLVSHRHATIELNNGRLQIRDLGSRNGTYLNDRQIETVESLTLSDLISVGRTRFTASLLKSKLQRKEREEKARLQTSLSAPVPSTTASTSSNNYAAKETISTAAASPDFQESYDNVMRGNFFAISLQLYLAKGAIGKTLENIQGTKIGPLAIRRIGEPLASAIRTLYNTQASVVDHNRLQEIVDSVVESIILSLERMYGSNAVSTITREATKALALLFPLSSDGRNYFESTGSKPGLSLLSELGFLGARRSRSCTTKEVIMADAADLDGVTVASATFGASLNNLPGIRTLTKAIAETFYFDKSETLKLINIVDEACTNSIEHGFNFKETNYFSLAFVRLLEDRLGIIVDDKGLPFDTEMAETGALDGLGLKLMREFCEEVHFLNLGKKGKRVLMILPLSSRTSEGLFVEATKAEERDESISDTPYSIETLHLDQATEIPKCVYRAYRYEYYDELLYRPTELRKVLGSEKMLSAMVFTKKRIAMGHMSVSIQEPDTQIGLLDHLILAPALNSTNMASRLTTYLIEQCRARGMAGLLVNMTAAHPYEQIVYTSLGARVTGIMLGYFPVRREGMDQCGDFPWKTRRQSAVTAFLKLGDMEGRKVYLPVKYADILSTIYDKLDLDREIEDSTHLNTQALPAISNVVMTFSPALGTASIQVLEIGDDISEIIEAKLIEISHEPIVAVYMDLPLSSPSISSVVDRLAKYNFYFSCLIPGELLGDTLRLQLLKADVDVGNIHVEEECGKSILYGINQERKNI